MESERGNAHTHPSGYPLFLKKPVTPSAPSRLSFQRQCEFADALNITYLPNYAFPLQAAGVYKMICSGEFADECSIFSLRFIF
jgi:hypothetical protein